MQRFDAIVIGAGPAGSTTALRLAREGASVLLLDKARFPRDKPCGGGLTGRALKNLPCPVDSVVEHVVDCVTLRLRYQLNRVATESTPYFSNRTNVSGDAGIAGNNQDPVNWGPPNLIFSGGALTLLTSVP